MTSPEDETTYELHLLVPSADRKSILVRDHAQIWQLPSWSSIPGDDHATVPALIRLLAEDLGLSSPVLEAHLPEEIDDRGTLVGLAVSGSAPEHWEPPVGLRWGDLHGPDPVVPDLIRPRVGTWLGEWRTNAAPPPLRPRWSRSGWHARAVAWIKESCERAGRPVDGPIEVRRLWAISVVMYARTRGGGAVWFKGVFPRFGHEPAVTELIGRAVPGAVPPVVAIEPEEGWILLDHIVELEPRPTGVDARVAEIRQLVRVQRELVGREGEFRDLGCPDRPLRALADDLEAATGGRPPLPGVNLAPERLRSLVGWVRDHAPWLDEIGLPEVLVHGDFHPGNVIFRDDGPVLIDWSDAAIAHPLLDVGAELGHPVRTANRPRYWTTWLDELEPLGPVEQLRDASDQVIALSAAYLAVSVAGILEEIEPANRQLSDDLDFFLTLLDSLVPQ